jgi:heme-degrading monooxygenase HmoA
VELFRRAKGYLCTQLLRDVKLPHHYFTIDRWESQEDHEAFLSQWREEYEALDLLCEGQTVHESLLGKWTTT